MVRLTCSRPGWGAVRDPESGEHVSLEGDVGPDVAERLVEEYDGVDYADESDDVDDSSLPFEEQIAFAESLIEEPWQSIVAEVESGGADGYLDQLENEERRRAERNGTDPRPSVTDAIETRREGIDD